MINYEIEDEIVFLANRINENVAYRRRHADRNSFLGVTKPPREKTDSSILRDIVCIRQHLAELANAIKTDNDPPKPFGRR